MNGEPVFLVYGATTEEWTARYGVEPFSHPCDECGAMLRTSIPFIQGTLRGLRAPACACGNELTPFTLVRDPRYGDFFTGEEARSPRAATSRRNVGRVRRWK